MNHQGLDKARAMSGTETRFKVLIVDDAPSNIQILQELLESDYQIAAATSGQKAIELATRAPLPDIILLDVMMPGMDGFEVCRVLKGDPIAKKIPIIFVTALAEEHDENLGFSLGAVDYITKPYKASLVKSRVKSQLNLYDQARHLEHLVQERTQALEASQRSVIERLGKAAEFKDNETGKHVIRMSLYAHVIGKAYGLSDIDAYTLQLAAAMHDIGKIGIPDHILLKPGKYTDEEYEVMKSHPQYGAEILGEGDTELLKMARNIALMHHEKWDGTGYPAGLKGEDIDLMARITAIADVFDALISSRPYKKGWPIEEAIEYIRDSAGSHFDPSLVPLFLNNIDQILDIYHNYEE